MLAIALVPCLSLSLSGGIAVTTLANQAMAANRWSEFLNKQVAPLLGFVRAVQEERLASVLALSGSPDTSSKLPVKRAKTDEMFAVMAELTPQIQELNPEAVMRSSPILAELGASTSIIRQAVDRGQSDIDAVDNHYSRLVSVIPLGLEGSAPQSFDATIAAEQMTAANLIHMEELHSRVMAAAAVTYAGDGPLPLESRRSFAFLVGGYRQQLSALRETLTDSERARLTRLTDSAVWLTATNVQDTIASQGVLPVPYPEWQAAAQAVDDELFGIFQSHALYTNDLAAAAASRSLQRSIWVGTAVFVVAFAAIMLALLLANRLVRRLRSLQSRSMELANVTLPSIIQRLHDGQQVDVDAESMILDPGADEIGRVAAAFNAAQRVAMGAAASEAQTREGFNKVFLDIAHRSQAVVRRQLEVLDVAESKQDDPEHLELLFQLDHLATRARRNAENLLILGGGNPGRRWRDPVALEHIVRSAVSETEDLSRVSAIRLPHTHVLGNAVADIVHLLAELIDNAILFSPPQSTVSIHGNLVGRGVVVEVEDQGLGIRFDERERFNELLRDPPDFQHMALSGQRHLGLFVVGKLAQRHSISVQLQDSAYGGVKAIVLIPAHLIEIGTENKDSDLAAAPPTRAVQTFGNGSQVLEEVPSLHGGSTSELPPWPVDGSAPVVEERIQFSHPALAAPPAHPDGAARVGRGQRAPLPRRQRQTHLAPQLRVEDETPRSEPNASDPPRPAQDVRRAMQSFQRGTRQARQSTAPHSHRATDGPTR
ncbi:sensor histidine kinase [Nocardia asiatica]|uniref:sensor histidine kinase n=1 Tax=Nocardia asiatica TaxID=209252 RepID=UPI001C3F353F|nr:nitrate- and nitrite sensing domain-containing protein [Nocardia asiatica]